MRYQSVGSGQWAVGSGRRFRARREDAAAKQNYPLPTTHYPLPTTHYPLPTTHCPSGVTLIEMLVVVAIIAILAVAGARTMQPALEGRRIREAARAVNVYLGVARNHALATGRPCGVLIRRFPGLEECSMVLEHAEQPAPYGGDVTGATATLQISGNNIIATLTNFNDSLVKAGDLVQFNHQGPFYKITSTGPPMTLQLDVSQGQLLPSWPDPVPYKIFRSPTKSAVGPLQLPTGTVIDLNYSGTDTGVSFMPIDLDSAQPGIQERPVIVMFSPNGAATKIYHSFLNASGNPVYGVQSVTDTIFLMIGKREQIGVGPGNPATDPEEDLANWQIFTNLWIAISPQTGLITTAEVASDTDIYDSRDFARQAQSMGGR